MAVIEHDAATRGWSERATAARVLVGAWGALLTVLTGLPVVVALARGFDPYDIAEGRAVAYLSLTVLLTGLVCLGAAARGTRRWAWGLVALASALLALAALVNLQDGGSIVAPVWRLTLCTSLALLPGLLLLVPRPRDGR